MKKIFFKNVFALMCACVMTASFVACGDDDPVTTQTPEEQPKPQEEVVPVNLKSATSEFTVTTQGLDALKAISTDGKVMVRYTYNTGEVKTEEITSSTFQKSLSYAFNDKKELVVSMQVYINDFDEEKLREIIGTVYMEVEMKGGVVLKYENTDVNYALKQVTNFNKFERTDEKVEAAVKTLKRDKERHGVIPFATYGLKATNASIGSSASWLGN